MKKPLAVLAAIAALAAVPAVASAHSLTMSRSIGARAIVQYGQRVLRNADLNGLATADKCQLSIGMHNTGKDLFCELTLSVGNSYGTTIAFCSEYVDAYWPSRHALRPGIIGSRTGFECSDTSGGSGGSAGDGFDVAP